MTYYLAVALIFACLLAGAELDPKRMKLAAAFALLVALCWPIVAGMVLRGVLLEWRDAYVVRKKARRMRA